MRISFVVKVVYSNSRIFSSTIFKFCFKEIIIKLSITMCKIDFPSFIDIVCICELVLHFVLVSGTVA